MISAVDPSAVCASARPPGSTIFSLPFFHDLDPRATRTPIKVHAIFRPEQERWLRMSSDELTRAIKPPETAPIKRLSGKFSTSLKRLPQHVQKELRALATRHPPSSPGNLL